MAEIRQAEAKVEIVGILKEKEFKIEPMKREGAMVNVIKGHVVLATDDVAEHTVKFFSYEKTKEGNDNKSFISLKTAMETMTSIVEATQNGGSKEDADIVEIKGTTLKVNEYHGQAGLVSRPEIQCSYMAHVKDKASAKLKAEFSTEVFFTGFKPEIVKGDETGRMVVSAILPMYNGIVAPITFMADGAVAKYLQ